MRLVWDKTQLTPLAWLFTCALFVPAALAAAGGIDGLIHFYKVGGPPYQLTLVEPSARLAYALCLIASNRLVLAVRWRFNVVLGLSLLVGVVMIRMIFFPLSFVSSDLSKEDLSSSAEGTNEVSEGGRYLYYDRIPESSPLTYTVIGPIIVALPVTVCIHRAAAVYRKQGNS